MSVGSNCLLRACGQSVWGQNVLGSKCLWGQNVFFGSGSKCLWGQSVSGVKMSSGSKFLGVKVSLGSKCRWGQSVFGVKMGVSRKYYLLFTITVNFFHYFAIMEKSCDFSLSDL